MQEPELEEERLTLDASARGLAIARSTLQEATEQVELIAPSGARSTLALQQNAPGVWRGEAPAPEQGLYEARSGNLRAFAAVGPLNPREAAALTATPDILRPFADATGGGVLNLGEDGRRLPSLRRVARGARAHGGDWIGIERNDGYTVRAAVASPLGSGWLWAFIGIALLFLGWRRESA